MAFSLKRSRLDATTAKAGSGCALILFGLFFAAIPSVMIFLMARGFTEEAKKRGWTATPCHVRKFEIEIKRPDLGNSEPRFIPRVDYSYQINGKDYVGHQIGESDSGTTEYEPLHQQRERLLAAPQTVCYVDPLDPASSVLTFPSKWRWMMILFPLLFVAIGLAIFVSGLKSLLHWKSLPALTTIARQKQKGFSGPLAWLFGLVFFGVGVGLFFPLLIKPLTFAHHAKNWTPTKCTIEWSRVKSHSGKSATYSFDVFYRYHVVGRDYFSQRFDFIGGSSSGKKSKEELTRKYPAGSKQVCYVNPDDPSQAVLMRELGAKIWLGLVPAPFTVIGFVMLVALIRKQRQRRTSTVAEPAMALQSATGNHSITTPSCPTLAPSGDVVLEPGKNRIGTFLALLLGAAFWNGIVWTIRFFAAEDKNIPFFANALLWVFAGIGILLAGAAGWKLLSLTNPRPTLSIHQAPLRLGAQGRISWQCRGQVSRIRQLTIRLEGIQEVMSGSGKSTHTTIAVFARIPLVNTHLPDQIAQGQTAFTVPPDTMHSLQLPHHKIIWKVIVTGEITRWPDVTDEYPVTILP